MIDNERLNDLYDGLSTINTKEDFVDESTQKLVDVIMQNQTANVEINEEANAEEIPKALLSSLSRLKIIIKLVKPGLDNEMSVQIKLLENEMDTVMDNLKSLNNESNHEKKKEAIFSAKEVLKNISALIGL